MGRKAKHQTFLDKSIEAAKAAIGFYNHPNNTYREEGFSILMINAWELLLKAIVLKANEGRIQSIYLKETTAKKDGKPSAAQKYKKNRSGNYRTIGFTSLIEQSNIINHELKTQLYLLQEIRDSSVHCVFNSDGGKKSILSVFAATLKSYVYILEQEFNQKISYDLYLIPLAFNIPEHFNAGVTSKEEKNLINLISQTHQSMNSESEHQICIDIDIKFNRSSKEGILVHTSDKGVPIRMDSEERFQKMYPWTFYDHLIPQLKKYKNFKQGKEFNAAKKKFETDKKFSDIRYLDWNKKSGTKKRFYSPNIMKELVKELGLIK